MSWIKNKERIEAYERISNRDHRTKSQFDDSWEIHELRKQRNFWFIVAIVEGLLFFITKY